MIKYSRLVALLLVLAVAAGSILVACAPKPAEEIKPIVLKVSMSGAPTATREKVYTEFLWPELEKRTKGKVKFELYYAESLLKLKDGLQGVSAGLADIAPFVPAYTQQQCPFGHIVWIPYQVPSDPLAGYRATMEMYNRYPEIFGLGWSTGKGATVKEFFPTFAGKFVIASTKKISKLEDMKGLKLRGVGRTGEWLSKMGATISSIPYTEVYTAMERGTIDGGQFYFGDICGYKISEVAKYVVDPRSGYLCTSWYIINRDTWNKLPQDVQEQFIKIRDELFVKLAESDAKEMAACIEECKKRGVEIIVLPPEEAARWKAVAQYLYEDYAKDINNREEIRDYLKSKGLTGEKVVAEIDQVVQKYSKK